MTSVTVPRALSRQGGCGREEDIGAGDLTAALIPDGAAARASVITRDEAVICGFPYVQAVFERLDGRVRIDWRTSEGTRAPAGSVLFQLQGPARALLTGERTALNFLQLLSGTATATRAYAERIAGTGCRLLDTRKTLPGLRTAQKYAVRVGGGENHRIGLFDGILIKENHILAAGSIAGAVAAARATGTGVPVEVEVESLEELRQAIAAPADIAMLDDFSLIDMAAGVASGGVRLETIRGIAETGVDFISVGSITKHVRAVDLSMRFDR